MHTLKTQPLYAIRTGLTFEYSKGISQVNKPG